MDHAPTATFALNSSVALKVPGLSPPKAKAAVLVAPAAPALFLGTLIVVVAVQLVPFQSSVTTLPGVLPPKAIAEVCIPAPDSSVLPAFISFTSLQLDPFQVSVNP